MVDAEAAYQRAIDLRPGDWQTYNALGNFYVATGRPLQAIAQFQHAIQLTPDNSWPYSNLGHAYQEADDPKLFGLAEQSFQHAIALDPNFVTYSNLGVLYAEERRFPEAIAAHRSALQFNDQTAGVWSNLAAAYAWTGSTREASDARGRAIQLYERATEVNAQEATSWASLAPLYAQNGNRDAALRAIHISLAQAPKDPYVLSQVAEAFELLNNRNEAVKYLQDAITHGISLSDLRGDFAAKDLISDPRLRIPGSAPKS
jgi:Flp pilus assembly protein TadD